MNSSFYRICVGIAMSALVMGSLPVQASEVVKLARLVVTGKRGAVEPAKAPRLDNRNINEATSHGGGDDHGAAPTPPRGVT